MNKIDKQIDKVNIANRLNNHNALSNLANIIANLSFFKNMVG